MSYSSKSFRLRREQNLSDEAEGSYSETSVRITMSYSSKSFRVRREQNLSDEDEGSDSETSVRIIILELVSVVLAIFKIL